MIHASFLLEPVLAAAEGSAAPLPTATTLVVIGAGVFTLPLLARRFRLPAVVLEIVFGLMIGPSLFALVEQGTADSDFISLLAELGLLLLMFLAGFEVDFERLERQGPGPIVFGLGVFGAIVACAWIGFGFLDPETVEERIFLTLLTSAASVGIVVPALRVSNRMSTNLGQLTLVVTVLAEFLSATVIVVFGVYVRTGFTFDLLGVPAFFAVLAIALFGIRRAAWWYPERFVNLFSADDPDEMGIRASLALLFVFVGIAIALGVEGILGAFLAGAVFSFVFRETGVLEERLSGFAYGFFIPVFFINVGIRFPIDRLEDPATLQRALALIAIAIAIKLLPSLLFMFRRLSLRESLAAGVLLAGQLSVIIALAEFGVSIGVIDEGIAAGAILLVGVTAILSPIVFRLLAPPLEGAPQAAAESMDT